ncbi:hypothetical protein QQF64_027160 [Cirrhinus molitorella]|uniref:Uncharacterized protein n=1 Tax=Cirrhinus molitorella TaxID=172907 RepID=A0ABR3NBL4_9TELE
MGCVRAPCCQEAGRRRKQTPANGDITCSPEQKLKQTINGQWTLCSRSSSPSLTLYLSLSLLVLPRLASQSPETILSQQPRPSLEIQEHVSQALWNSILELMHENNH